jgi:hypothetical protein
VYLLCHRIVFVVTFIFLILDVEGIRKGEAAAEKMYIM